MICGVSVFIICINSKLLSIELETYHKVYNIRLSLAGWLVGVAVAIVAFSDGATGRLDWAAMTNQRDRCFVFVCFEIWLESFWTTVFFSVRFGQQKIAIVLCLLVARSHALIRALFLLAFSFHSSINNFFSFSNFEKGKNTNEYLLTKSFQIVNVLLAIKFQEISSLNTIAQEISQFTEVAHVSSRRTNMCGVRARFKRKKEWKMHSEDQHFFISLSLRHVSLHRQRDEKGHLFYGSLIFSFDSASNCSENSVHTE